MKCKLRDDSENGVNFPPGDLIFAPGDERERDAAQKVCALKIGFCENSESNGFRMN